MRLDWERPGVVRATLRVEELAALVSGARVAAAALADRSGEQAKDLDRVLDSFDRAIGRLSASPPAHDDVATRAPPGSKDGVVRNVRASSAR